jgi:hypothetical protein
MPIIPRKNSKNKELFMSSKKWSSHRLSFVFLLGSSHVQRVLAGQFHISYFAYGTALINALVIAKVILTGDALHAGTRYENKAALPYSAIWKAFVFGFLVFAFHLKIPPSFSVLKYPIQLSLSRRSADVVLCVSALLSILLQ